MMPLAAVNDTVLKSGLFISIRTYLLFHWSHAHSLTSSAGLLAIYVEHL